MEGVLALLLLVGLPVAGFVVYFLPFFIAGFRSHPNVVAIGALNFLLGWTIIGWVGALVWSLTSHEAHR